MIAQVPIISHTEPRHGADAGAGIGQHTEHGAIAEANDVTGIDRPEQLAGLLDGELGGLAFGDAVFEAADRSEGIERNRVTLYQGVEEMPQRGKRLVLGGRRAGELADVFTGKTWRDLAQRDPSIVAPVEEAAGDAAVGPPGVLVTKCGPRKTPRPRTRRWESATVL